MEDCSDSAAASRPIRVAHLTTIDESLRFLLLDQLVAIRKAGYAVTGISARGAHGPELASAGIRFLPIPLRRGISPFRDLLSLFRLFRLFRHERFEIVHTHTPKVRLLGHIAARLAGVQIIVNTLHGFHLHAAMSKIDRSFFTLLERSAARLCDIILSQSREDVETAIARNICPRAKIRYLGNGIDLEAYNPDRFSTAELAAARESLGIDSQALVVGFVGRLARRRKGFDDFISSATVLAERDPSIRFLIVGAPDASGPDAVQPSQITASSTVLARSCIFTGSLRNSELPILYANMNVVVLPSLFEGVPRVLMEAAAMGVPSVATDVRGNREVVIHGETGLLVPLGDVTALTDAIQRVIADAEWSRRLGLAARRVARESFDQRRVFERVLEHYDALLSQRYG